MSMLCAEGLLHLRFCLILDGPNTFDSIHQSSSCLPYNTFLIT